MGLDRFFKPRSRSEKESRMMRPDEIEQAAHAVEGAVRTNLGREKIDANRKDAFKDLPEFVGEAAANWEQLQKLHSRQEYRELETAIGASVEEEFKQKGTDSDVATRRAIASINHNLARQRELGWNPSVLWAIIQDSSPEAEHDFGESKTLALFSPQIQEAIRSYHRESQIREEERRVLSTRADTFKELSEQETTQH